MLWCTMLCFVRSVMVLCVMVLCGMVYCDMGLYGTVSFCAMVWYSMV